MATNQLLNSLETALQTILLNQLAAGSNVYTGKDSRNKKLPCYIVAADGDAEEDPPHSGNHWVNVSVSAKSTSATDAGATQDPKVADLAFGKAMFDVVRVNNGLPSLDAQINALGMDLTIFPTAVFYGAPKSGWGENDAWVDEQLIRFYCCASAIP